MTAVAKGAGPAADVEKHRRAVRANPRDAQAHALLGLSLQKLGQFEEALASQRRALALNPKLVALHGVMGQALAQLKRHDEAAASFRAALEATPDDADLHKDLSDSLRKLKQYDEAEASARRAAALRPDDAAILTTLAAALYGRGELESAEQAFRRALELNPDMIEAHFSLGLTLQGARRFEEAAACQRRVIELDPRYLHAHIHLGASLNELKQHAAAEEAFRAALALAPDHRIALHDLGVALRLQGKADEALAVFERGLRLDPKDGLVLGSLTQVCFDLGLWERAVEYARRAREVAPDLARVYSVLLFVLSHCCSDPVELTREHRGYGERFETPLREQWRPHANDRDPGRVLRVGFVSADLYKHAVASFIEPVFQVLHQSTQLSLYAYYNNHHEDMVTRRLRQLVPNWTRVIDMDDDTLAEKIRADGIDILIDLSGHSAKNRLPVFARKPAPVQASWIGYAGTTGLDAVDYYLGDQFYLPPGRYDDQFTEKIVRLPLAAPFLPDRHSPDINALPALTNGYVTFGSFHRASKLSREVVALWAQLLREVPGSKMLLGGQSKDSEEVLLGWFDEQGIDRSRLIVRQRTGMAEYLAQHHEVDICVAPFPYTGGTTIGHALWMGVPTLMTVGPTNPSHAAVSYMAHLGLSSFIADSEAGYVQLGAFLAQNLPTLATLRATMRERFTNSVIGYPGVAAASVELALRVMWERWCAGQPVESFQVRLSDLVPAEEGAA